MIPSEYQTTMTRAEYAIFLTDRKPFKDMTREELSEWNRKDNEYRAFQADRLRRMYSPDYCGREETMLMSSE